jgi:hypothetical protein
MSIPTAHDAVSARSLTRSGSGRLASVDPTVRWRRLAAVRTAMTHRDQSVRRDAHAPRVTDLARLIPLGALDLPVSGHDPAAQSADEDALAGRGA